MKDLKVLTDRCEKVFDFCQKLAHKLYDVGKDVSYSKLLLKCSKHFRNFVIPEPIVKVVYRDWQAFFIMKQNGMKSPRLKPWNTHFSISESSKGLDDICEPFTYQGVQLQYRFCAKLAQAVCYEDPKDGRRKFGIMRIAEGNDYIRYFKFYVQAKGEPETFSENWQCGSYTMKYKNGQATVTSKMVLEIVKLLKQNIPNNKIARRFKISTIIVKNIKSGKSWNHVTGI
jgi:hypothetical protein